MKHETAISVLIAESLSIVRAGLRALLQGENGLAVVGETDNAAGLMTTVARLKPDVLLLVPPMPGSPPDRLLAGATAVHPAMRVLVLACPDDVSAAIALLEAGASGCILKSDRPEELVRGIRTVAAGGLAVSNVVTRHLLHRQTDRPARATEALTEREREVYDLLATGLSNKEIAQRLYLSVRTVEVHLRNLYSKLGVRSRLEAVSRATSYGCPSPAGRRG